MFSVESFLFEDGSALHGLDNYYKARFTTLQESSKIIVSEAVMTEMFKFITDKYNSIDFREIEISGGDYPRFKYKSLIDDNIITLNNIYTASENPSEDIVKYQKVLESVKTVEEFLTKRAADIKFLYGRKNGVIQLMYTSSVSAMIYSISALITNTLRFITDNDGIIEATFDEIPNSVRNVHIKNITNIADNIESFDKLVSEYMRVEKNGLTESITVGAFTTGVLAVGAILYLIPKIIIIIREIIYTIYYMRVSISDALKLQALLIQTNVESLSVSGGKKKVIAKQKKIAEALMHWSDKIAVKMDSASPSVKREIKKENKKLESVSAYEIDSEKNNPSESPRAYSTLPASGDSDEVSLMI